MHFFPFLLAETETISAVSPTAIVVIAASILVAVGTAFALNRAAHAKKEIRIEDPNALKREVVSHNEPVSSGLRDKLSRLPVRTSDREATLHEISKIVEEETETRLKEVKQEYSVKYQVMVQEKNKEVEGVRREYNKTVEKYDEAQRLYKRTEIEKKNTEAVVKSIADGLVVVNDKGEVLLMNPAAEKILGTQSQKKVGKSVMEGLGSEHLVSMSRQLDASGEKVVEYTSKDENVKKVIRSSSAVIQNEDGQTIGMVNVLTDITKQKELDEIKSRFVSNVTHELRTPIVAMQKAIEILMDKKGPPLSDMQQNFLGIVQRNMSMLSRLVEDLLDMAKIESGKMRLKFAPARIDKVVSEACEALVTWANSKEIQLEKDIDKSLPELSVDSVKITQVLNNLIGNAIKFTPKGGKIYVGCAWHDAQNVKITVRDTGVGIAKENLAKLFGRFEQFGDLQGISGTGLGLCISKEITERHGGKIWVESEEKKGATFTFTLPIKQQTVIGGV